MNWLRGFRRLGWVLIVLSAVPAWWISSAEATYTVTIEGEFIPGTDARPPLARLREKMAAGRTPAGNTPETLPADFFDQPNLKTDSLSDPELLAAVKRKYPGSYDDLTLTRPTVEQK